MSVLNATGDFSLSEGIGKRLMTPGGAVAPGIAPEIFPCVVLENDRPEMLFLTGASRFSRGTSIGAGGAGTRSTIHLINARPDQLLVVERLEVTPASGLWAVSTLRWGVNVLPVGTQTFGVPLDTRRGIERSSSAVIVLDNTLASPTSIYLATFTAYAVFTTPIVLRPGDGMVIQPTADNVAINLATLTWRERKVNPSELG